jgi:hypothetical protein
MQSQSACVSEFGLLVPRERETRDRATALEMRDAMDAIKGVEVRSGCARYCRRSW